MKETIVYLNLSDQEKKRIEQIEGYHFNFFAKNETIPQEVLDKCEVLVGNLPEATCNNMPNLKYVQLDTAGVDRYTNLNKDILLANAKDVYGEAIGEWMLSYVLAIQKRIPEFLHQQEEHIFKTVGQVDNIMGSTVLVVGMGSIGSAFARRMHALGATVDGVTRTKKPCEDYVRAMYTMDQLDDILGNYDIIALVLPQTEQTIGYFNEERLLKMRKDSILLNVGRGSAIITDDIVRVLEHGHFKGVYLDVMNPEPLPKNHILWRLDRVIITPHAAGNYSSKLINDNVIELIEHNLAAYLKDEPLHHTIDRSIGY